MNVQDTCALCFTPPIALLYTLLWLTFKGSIISEMDNAGFAVAETVPDFYLQKVILSKTS